MKSLKKLQPTRLKKIPYKIWVSLSVVEKIATLLVIIVALFIVFYNICNRDSLQMSDFVNGILLAIVPTFPIIFLWYDSQKKQWLSNLQTYLDITLECQGTTIAFFELIPVQDTVDIRQQTQTLFQRINESNKVAGLYPVLSHDCLSINETPVTFNDFNENNPFKLYEVVFKVDGYFSGEVAVGKANKEVKFVKYIEIKKEGDYMYWCPNHPTEVKYHEPSPLSPKGNNDKN